MGNFIKEKYICSLSCIKRFKGTCPGENHYWVGGGLRAKPDRPDTRFYSGFRLSRRPSFVANRNLAGYTANSTACLEGVSGPGSKANIGYASQPSSCNCNYCYLGSGNRYLYLLVMAICQWRITRTTIASKPTAKKTRGRASLSLCHLCNPAGILGAS